MVDPLSALRTHLLANTALVAEIGGRCWAGETEPPQEAAYTPDDGGAVAFTGVGGTDHHDQGMISPRMQFKVYAATPAAAMTTYRALHDALATDKGLAIMDADLESGPINLRETDTQWPFVLAFWRVHVRNG